jgi:dTDP-4-dehydrorhamnose reductase
MLGQALIHTLCTLDASIHQSPSQENRLPWHVVALSRSPYEPTEAYPTLPEAFTWLVGDVCESSWLKQVLATYAPQAMIHTVACVDLLACERDPLMAYQVNTYPVGLLSDYAQRTGSTLLHISTDHYYQDHTEVRHTEQDTVVLLNEYARTKYLAEKLALLAPNGWVIRTNIIGHKRHPKKNEHRTSPKPTFLEWLEQALSEATPEKPVKLFHDYYTSSVHVGFLATWLIAWMTHYAGLQPSSAWNPLKSQFLSEPGAACRLFHSGSVSLPEHRILNVACRQASSKFTLGKLYAHMVLGYSMDTLNTLVEGVSIHDMPQQEVVRATALGLETSWVELCFPDMPSCPSLLDVVESFQNSRFAHEKLACV